MEQDKTSSAEFGSYSALFRRRRVWIFTILPAVLLVSIWFAYALPAKYRSSATIILEQGSIPNQLIQSTVNSPPEQQIEIIQGRALNLESLKELVTSFDPYPEHPEWSVERKAQAIIEDTSLDRVDPVSLLPQEHSPAFSLFYMNPNPSRAAVVTARLADLFLTYHQRLRREAAKAGARLMENQAASLSKELQAVDDEFAKLRMQHGGVLPDAGDRMGEEARYRAARDLDTLERDLRTAQERESLLAGQLAGISPNLMARAGDLTDFATVKAQLADAEQRYTPDHPDVKRLRRALAALMEQGPTNTTLKADNPEYRRVAAQLAGARGEIAGLQQSIGRARTQLMQYTANLNPSAEVSRRTAELERRRSALQGQFQDAQTKLRSAEMGQVVEADDTHAEHFSLIRAPYPASLPYSPNRIGIILLGLVLGAGLAAAAVAVSESLDVTVRGARDVVGYAGIPVLGNVTNVALPHELRRRKLVWGSVTAAYLLVALLVTMVVIRAEVRDNRVETASHS